MTVQQRLDRHLGKIPDLGQALWVARNATVVGDVSLGVGVSVFYGAVLRGDIARIVVGEATNLQDNVVVHVADDLDAQIGARCTIGHAAIIHACKIGDECLIGMGAKILDGAEVGDRCLIGAGTVVLPGIRVPARSLVVGLPGKVIRSLTEAESDGLKQWAEKYTFVARAHAAKEQANPAS